MPSVTLEGRRIEYSVVGGRRNGYVYFRFRPDATLEVVAPSPRSFDAERAILRRGAWVLKHFLEVSSGERILGGDTVMFDGKQLRLTFVRTEGKEELRPDLPGGILSVMAPSPSSTRELLRRWFLKETSSYVIGALPEMARRLGVKYRRADVREIKNWGYCTRDGRVSFSWQLIALSERLRVYVLYHELAHLLHHDHSLGFKSVLASVLPDYRQRERELDRITPI